MKFVLPDVTFTLLLWDLTVWEYYFGSDVSWQKIKPEKDFPEDLTFRGCVGGAFPC